MECNVFITLMTPGWADKIIAQIVKWGFGVAPLTRDGYLLTHEGSPSALLTLKVNNVANNKCGALRDEIVKYLDFCNINYYSLVVVAPNALSWIGSNITLNRGPAKVINKPRLKETKVPHLKVVDTTPIPPPLPNLPPAE